MKNALTQMTPLAAATSSAILYISLSAAAEDTIVTSQNYAEDTTVNVPDRNTVNVPFGQNITISVAGDKTLTLINSISSDDPRGSFAVAQSYVIDATSGKSLTFSGGKVVLQKQDAFADVGADYNEQAFIRSTDAKIHNPGKVIFANDTTVLEGSLPYGFMLRAGNVEVNNDFTMNLDRRSVTASTAKNVIGTLLQEDAMLSLHGKNQINIIGSAYDSTVQGIQFGPGGNALIDRDLLLSVDGNNAAKTLYGFYFSSSRLYAEYEQDINIDGNLDFTLQNAPEGTAYALPLVSDRNYSFNQNVSFFETNVKNAYGIYTDKKVAAKTVNVIQNNILNQAIGLYLKAEANVTIERLQTDIDKVPKAWAIYADNNAELTADSAVLSVNGTDGYAIRTNSNAHVVINNDLNVTAVNAISAGSESIVDIKKNFSNNGLSVIAMDNGSVNINSSGKGTVKFSGITTVLGSGSLNMELGSAGKATASYWNVAGLSDLTVFNVGKNASLNFFLTEDLQGIVNSDDAVIKVNGEMPVVFHTGDDKSKVAVVAQGLKADVGDEISLVSSKSGFALNSAANLIYAGASLNELKTDLDLRSVESVLRVRESEIKASQYDLLLKTDDLLIAQIKAEDPIEPRESVNPESNALMESSASVYATMFAADDLIVDTALKSRNGKHEGLFVAAKGGEFRYNDTINADIFTGVVGYSLSFGSVDLGPFFETGHTKYRTKIKTEEGKRRHDSGSHTFAGVGMHANWQTPYLVKISSYVKGGILKNEFQTSLSKVNADLSESSAYWGAHLGASLDAKLSSRLNARPYLSYFYDGRSGEEHFVAGNTEVGGADFKYDDLNAHRIRIGSVMDINFDANWHPYVGIAYERIIKAKASGIAKDADGILHLNGTNIDGGSEIYSLGISYTNDAKDIEFSVGGNGYSGEREGLSGQVYINWHF